MPDNIGLHSSGIAPPVPFPRPWRLRVTDLRFPAQGACMNFHEYQAKELFAAYGIPVPPGKVAQRLAGAWSFSK